MYEKTQPKQIVGAIDPNGEPESMRTNPRMDLKVVEEGGNGVVTDINGDAWGRTKKIIDYSIFHSLFTYDVSGRQWILTENGVEILPQNSTKINSISGTLVVQSGINNGDISTLQSRVHPRYQPNRGQLYSTAVFCPDSQYGERRWGLYTQNSNSEPINGVMFELISGILYASLYTEGNRIFQEVIDVEKFEIDVEKGNLYDIQFQWRGVGNYFFYINQKLVYILDLKYLLDFVSIANPSLSVGFSCKNIDGNEVILKAGCVDVSSEGGQKEGKTYTGVSNLEDVFVNSKSPPVGLIIVHNKSIFNGKINTRDCQLLRATVSTEQDSRFVIYTTRDITAFTGLNLTDRYVDSALQYQDASSDPFGFDVTKGDLLTRGTVALGNPFILTIPTFDVQFNVAPGDYLIFMGEKKSQNSYMSGTLEFGEEI